MAQDPLMLYKLIILYMLDSVAFPLTKAQVGDFILEKEYTNFLTLQQTIADLTDGGFVSARSLANRTHLAITERGQETLRFFENRISDAIKQEIHDFIKENELELRNEVSILAEYYKSTRGEYETELKAKDRGADLITIRLSVPTEEMAVSICDHWREFNQEIYQYLTQKLF